MLPAKHERRAAQQSRDGAAALGDTGHQHRSEQWHERRRPVALGNEHHGHSSDACQPITPPTAQRIEWQRAPQQGTSEKLWGDAE